MKQHHEYDNLYVADHPLIMHKLSHMRDEACEKVVFKTLLKEISLLMGYELTRHMKITQRKITTPLTDMDAPFLADKSPVIIPILRAGLGMTEGLEELIPTAKMGHIGLYRDENTKKPVEYLVKLPPLKDSEIILVDPMLATGHSARYALELLVKHGAQPKNIRFMALVAAPEGVKVLKQAFEDVPVYVAALDGHLNENAYIVPGLGDAGDRMFGTEHD